MYEVDGIEADLTGLHQFVIHYFASTPHPSQAQISGERSAVQQIDELDSQLRFSSAEVWTRAVLAMTITDNHFRWLIGFHVGTRGDHAGDTKGDL